MADLTARAVAACWLAACISNTVVNEAMAQGGDYSPDFAVFDGSQSMAIQPDPALAVNGDITVEFWVAPGWENDPGFDPVVVSNISVENASYIIAIMRDRDGVGVLSGGAETVAPFDFSDGKLHHVAIIAANDGFSIVVDGGVRGISETALGAYDVDAFWIGSIDGSLGAFTGYIGQLRIWNAALDLETLEAFKFQPAFPQGDIVHPFIDALVAASMFPEAGLLLVENETAPQ